MSLWHMRNPVRYCLVPLEGNVVLFESLYGDPVLTLGLPTVDEMMTPVPMPTLLAALMCPFFPQVGVCMGNAGERLPEMADAWARQMHELLQPITKQMGSLKVLALCRSCEWAVQVGMERFNVRSILALDALGRKDGIDYNFVDAEEATVPARKVKLPEEVEVVRRGTRIVEGAVNQMREAIQPGMTENELWSVMHQGVIAQDCEWVETRLLSSGPRTNPWYQECGEREIQEGELVALDTDVYGPGGYFIDLSRTFLCGDGPATDQQRNNYQLAMEMLEHNRQVLKPGLTFKQFSELAWKLPAPYIKNSYLISLHGNGVAGEYPLIYHPHMFDEWGYDGLIEEGMMVSFEAFIGHEDGGEGVKLEQHALVTAEGTEILSTGVPFEDRLMATGTPVYHPKMAAQPEASEAGVVQRFIPPAPHAPSFIDLQRYPLDRAHSAEYRELVEQTKEELADDGCCVLPGFLNPEACQQAVREVEARGLADVFYRRDKNNIYFSDSNELPEEHPGKILMDRSQGFIAGDSFDDQTSVLKQVFFYQPLTYFLSQVLEVRPLYLSEDPLSGVVVSCQKDEQQFPWHFDGAEFIVTVMIQKPLEGGLFQYAPNIRSEDNENLEAVKELLEGDMSRVRTLELQTGDVQLFKGKYSAHRVTAVDGEKNRYLGALAWAPIPNYVNTVERNMINVGRAVDVNYQRSKKLSGGMIGY